MGTLPRRLKIGLALLGAGLWWCALSATAEPIRTNLDETISSRLQTRLIRIEPVPGKNPEACLALGAEGLRVRLRGVEVPPEAVDLDRRRPPSLHAIVVDTSASMSRALPYARFAAAEYVKQLRPGHERALVASFDEIVELHRGATSDHGRLLSAIAGLNMGGQTALLDGIYYAMRELDTHRERPVMILLSDGADTASLYDEQDVLEQLTRRPDLTVFTIGLSLQLEHGHKPTRDLLVQLAECTQGRFFDVDEGASLQQVFAEIRATVESEAVLTVVDPDPRLPDAELRVRSRDRNCRVTVLGSAADAVVPRERGASSDRLPLTVPFAPIAEYGKLYTRSARRTADPACSDPEVLRRAATESGWFEPNWFIRMEQGAVGVCGPDLILEPGPLYSPEVENMVSTNEVVSIRTRRFRIEIPPLAELPRRPEQLMERLGETARRLAAAAETGVQLTRLPAVDHARPHYDFPSLAHGMSLQGMRERIAWALFMHEDYREWAQQKIARDAQTELQRLEQRYTARFPGLPSEGVAVAARQSDEGRRILARVAAPTEKDLQPYLAAWLGDLSAQELFTAWERSRIDRALAGTGEPVLDAAMLEAWRELRRVFYSPSYSRVLTLLDPVRDTDCDCVGFWRVVLPRSSWLHARALAFEIDGEPAVRQLDLIADVPFGAWLMQQIARVEPALLAHLREGRYRVAGLEYALMGKTSLHRPESAFESSRVTIRLRRAANDALLELIAEMQFDPFGTETPLPRVRGLKLTATGDDALRELARRARRGLLRITVESGEPDGADAG